MEPGPDFSCHTGQPSGVSENSPADQSRVGCQKQQKDRQKQQDGFFDSTYVDDREHADQQDFDWQLEFLRVRGEKAEQSVAGGGDGHGDREHVIDE